MHAHAAAAARASQLEAALAEERASNEDRASNVRSEYNKACEDRVKAETSERITKETMRMKEMEKDKVIQVLENKFKSLMTEKENYEANQSRTEITMGALKEQARLANEAVRTYIYVRRHLHNDSLYLFLRPRERSKCEWMLSLEEPTLSRRPRKPLPK